MKKILRVGIAGFGIVGKRRKFYIDKNPKFKVIAISDISFKKTIEKKKKIIYLKKYRDLLKQDIDVLFVCLPNRYASQATIDGLRNNIHVFCEKPPGRTVREIKKVIIQEKRNKLIKLKYGFNHRYHDAVVKLSKIIKSKKYGEIINFRGVYGKSKIITFSNSDWRSKRSAAGGGILLDQGIHLIDLILNLTSEIKEVHSFISNNYWKHNVEDNAYVMFKDKKGVVAMIHSTATQWEHKFRLEITLEKALIELTGILSGSKSYGKEKLRIVDKGKNKIINISNFNFTKDLSWKREIDEFCDIIMKNKKVINGNSKDALRVMELIYKIYKSDKTWSKKYLN